MCQGTRLHCAVNSDHAEQKGSSVKIVNNQGTETSEAATVMAYYRRPTESMQDFYAQLKQLDPESKRELAVGAAKELGWTLVDQ